MTELQMYVFLQGGSQLSVWEVGMGLEIEIETCAWGIDVSYDYLY